MSFLVFLFYMINWKEARDGLSRLLPWGFTRKCPLHNKLRHLLPTIHYPWGRRPCLRGISAKGYSTRIRICILLAYTCSYFYFIYSSLCLPMALLAQRSATEWIDPMPLYIHRKTAIYETMISSIIVSKSITGHMLPRWIGNRDHAAPIRSPKSDLFTYVIPLIQGTLDSIESQTPACTAMTW